MASLSVQEHETREFGGDLGSGGEPQSHERVAGTPGDITHNLPASTTRMVEQRRRDVFPFLELPAELRVRIYELLLAPAPRGVPDYLDKPIQRCVIYEATRAHSKFREIAILRACKQIHAEATDVLYSNATFSIRTSTVVGKGVMARNDIPFQGGGIDRSRIQKLRIEIEFVSTPVRFCVHLVDKIGSTFNKMRNLRQLRIMPMHASSLNMSNVDQRKVLVALAQAVPEGVDVTWGLPAEERRDRQYRGRNFLQGEVLREIVGSQGQAAVSGSAA
ncbi:hypothetical protein P171DRAFT_290788 [Karstenula rhodostoma CBS 690.94]|uniref:F-box domain-containing protein n=1 Tax=Karstenula rhodostoma CBS 690.94 TaxID=1392251 RepID=A0A9P4UB38_9PLEO|nr:hypothetical protein P171DRAFT_290788 [Karstenula rhodostoma CBS 690.94]